MKVNGMQLAEILGVDPKTVTRWQADGLPVEVRGERGQENTYDTEAVIAWYVRRELARAQAESPRDRLDKIRAQREELGLRRDIGNLVDVAALESAIDRWAEDVSTTIDGFPEKYALLLQQVTDVEGQHQLLQQLGREIRHVLGSYDFAAAAAGVEGGDAALDVGAGAADDSPVSPAA